MTRRADDPRDEVMVHVPALRAFALSLTRNIPDADDLVQDTIVKAWSNFDKFTVGTDLRAWMFTILRNVFFSRKRKTRREVEDPDQIHENSLFERPAHDGRIAFAEFQRAFDKLTPEHREVLVLVGANGYSCEEAAQVMGVAVGTVKSRTNRARAKLCEMLGVTGGEDFLPVLDGTTAAVMGRSATRAA
ncbi:MAG: RNA polymerase sigma factor [Gemmobacter sp.]